MAQIKGFTVELDGNTLKLQKALKQIQSPITTLKGKLKEVENAMRFDKYNPELIAQKQKYLNQEIEQTQDKLKTLKKYQAEAAAAMEAGTEGAEDAYDRLTREIVFCEKAMQRLNQQAAASQGIGLLGTRLTDVGNKLSSIGNKMMPATLGIGIAGAAATSAAVEFDTAFTGVTKTVDASDEEIAKLRDGIRQMAKEIPASTTEIAAVAEAAGQLGIETDNILGFTEVMIGLGEATNLSADEAAFSLARFANVTGMAQTDFERLGSTVVALGNNFETTESEIVAMGMRLSSAGTGIGLTESQIMGLATAMSSLGLEAEAGGTAMSQTMVQIDKAVSSGGAKLEQFASVAGMSASEFAKQWESSPMDAIQAFINGLGDVENKGGNLNNVLDELGMSGIRQSDALRRLAGSSNILAEAIGLSTDAWEENTALSEETEKRYGSLASQLKNARNDVYDLGITVGEILAPLVIKASEAIGKLAEWLKNLSPTMQKVVVVIGLAVAAAGPVLSILGFMATGIGSFIGVLLKLVPILTALPNILTVLTTAFRAFGVALMANPIGAIITAAIALGVALIALYNNCEGFRNAVNAIWESIKTAFTIAVTAIVAVARSVASGVVAAFNALSQIPGKIKSALSSAVSAAKGFVSKFASVGKSIIDGIVRGIKSAPSAVANALKNVVDNAINAVKRKLGINSPSKLFRDQIGKMIPAGMAIGINDNAEVAVKSARNLANATVDAAKVASDVELQSNVGQTQTVSTTGANVVQLNALLEEYLPRILAASDKAILLDGKKLVGGTINEVNRQLGTIGQRQGRTVMA